MPSTTQRRDGRLRLGVLPAGVAVTAGLAGWGGTTIALAGHGTAPAVPSRTVQEALPTGAPVTAAPTSSARPTGVTTSPVAPSPVAASLAEGASSPSVDPRSAAAPPPVRAAGPGEPPRHQGRPDIVFVRPYSDGEDGSGRWYYQVGLLGFPADTVVELSGPDDHGNVRVAPLALTTAEGSVNPFSQAFSMHFPYGGTCDTARRAAVTARGAGFAITEVVPRPLECDGGTTPAGPWAPPHVPMPTPTPAPTSAWTPGG